MLNINTQNITRKIVNNYGIKAKKRFGQNFLIDDNVLNQIISASKIVENTLIIEIGPGLGNLSEYILNASKYALLIEIDKDMIEILNDRFNGKYTNFEILNEDVLNVDLDEKIPEIEKINGYKFTDVKIIANLPYYITTPIIFKLLQKTSRVSEVIVMVQKEVAQRMVANNKSKDYGILTLMVKYFSNPSIVVNVPRTSFIPAPNVDSAVIRLEKSKNFKVQNEDILFELIHKAFALRRKKVINSLVSNKFQNLTKEQIEDILNRCQVNLNSRAEELEIEKYIEIANIVDKLK